MLRKQENQGAVSIDIRGAKGPNAVTINGVYEPTEEVCSGWPVYRKRGDSTKWLEFFSASSKWYIKATSDKGRARGWMRLTADPATRPELCKSICEVWDGNKWTSQPSVSIVTAKQRREEDKRAGAERLAQSVPVDIRGALGPSASSINGIYEPTNEVCGGWPVYRKHGDPDKWLEYIVATNEWYVKPTTDRGRAEGWMCLASDPPTRPELSRGTCEVWDGERWTIQSTVTVLTAASGFESTLDVRMYCLKEARDLQEKLNASLNKSVTLLGGLPASKIEAGTRQLEEVLQDMDERLKQLCALKEAEKAENGGEGGRVVVGGSTPVSGGGGGGGESTVIHPASLDQSECSDFSSTLTADGGGGGVGGGGGGLYVHSGSTLAPPAPASSTTSCVGGGGTLHSTSKLNQ